MPTITQAQAGWLTVGVVVLVVLCGLALCLMTYAAMAIGQSFKKNKGLMSVVFFFVLWIGTRIVLTLIFGAFYGSASAAVSTMTVLQALWTVLGCACRSVKQTPGIGSPIPGVCFTDQQERITWCRRCGRPRRPDRGRCSRAR